MMGGVDGGDDNGLDLGVLDHAVAVVAEGADAVLGGGVVSGGGHIVGDGHDGSAGDGLDDAAAVIAADSAAADDTDFQNLIHDNYLPFLL